MSQLHAHIHFINVLSIPPGRGIVGESSDWLRMSVAGIDDPAPQRPTSQSDSRGEKSQTRELLESWLLRLRLLLLADNEYSDELSIIRVYRASLILYRQLSIPLLVLTNGELGRTARKGHA